MIGIDPAIHLAAWALFLTLWARVHAMDSRLKRISNRSIAAGLGCTALLLAGHVGFMAPAERPAALTDIAMVSALSAVFGVTLWLADTWPAGDAKLFFLLCLLGTLLRHLQGITPAFVPVLLANTFVVAAAFVLLQMAVASGRTPLRGLWTARPRLDASPAEAFRLILSASCYALLFGAANVLMSRALNPRFGGSAGLFASGLLVVNAVHFRRWLFGPVFGYHKILCLSIVAVLLLGPAPGPAVWSALKSGALMLAVYRFVLEPINAFLEQSEVEKVSAKADLRRMVLSAAHRDAFLSDPDVAAKDLGPFRADGLNSAQASAVGAWFRARGIAEVEVYRTHPFAFWLFLGTLLTAALKRDVVTAALEALRGVP
jgi:hypothetical protein